MMRLAIFARTYPGPSLGQTLDAILRDGFDATHFNLRCVGQDATPAAIDAPLCERVRSAFAARGLEMVGLSGTFNAIDPDPIRRRDGVDNCRKLIKHAPALGTRFISLCTGTRDGDDMWRAHPDNHLPEAWRDLLTTLEQLLPTAQQCGVALGIEPERANVINSAVKARRLLDELRSPSLKVILDGANLFDPDHLTNMQSRLAEAFDLLSPDIAHVHAKDIPIGSPGASQAAGTGSLDWEAYFDLICRSGFRGPIVLHNLAPAQVADSRDFVLNHLARVLP